MKHLTRTMLLAAGTLCLFACKAKEEPALPDEPPKPDQTAAISSFDDLIAPKIDLSDLLGSPDSAAVRKIPDGTGVESAYGFLGRGGVSVVAPVLERLGSALVPTEDQTCWMPWEELIDLNTSRPGAFMGAFRGEDFQLTLWIDQFARDLFICFREPAPPATTEAEEAEEAEQSVQGQ